jgi:Arm DNA-binding domain
VVRRVANEALAETESALLSTLPVCRCQQDIRFGRAFKPICLYVSVAVSHNLALICGLIRGPHMGRLTARKVETAKPGKYGDGAGLQLSVAPTGAKKRVLRFLWQGKAREMGLGSYPEVGLSEAREQALAGRRLARSGGDPIAERKKDKRVPTFGELADEVVAEQSKGFRNEKAQGSMGDDTQRVCRIVACQAGRRDHDRRCPRRTQANLDD